MSTLPWSPSWTQEASLCHTYCKDCLQGLALRSLDWSNCSTECHNVLNIPNTFHMNHILEAFHHIQKAHCQEEDQTDSETLGSTGKCQPHPTQALVLYCETCREQLCWDCMLKDRKGCQPQVWIFKEVVDESRKKTEVSLTSQKSPK